MFEYHSSTDYSVQCSDEDYSMFELTEAKSNASKLVYSNSYTYEVQ